MVKALSFVLVPQVLPVVEPLNAVLRKRRKWFASYRSRHEKLTISNRFKIKDHMMSQWTNKWMKWIDKYVITGWSKGIKRKNEWLCEYVLCERCNLEPLFSVGDHSLVQWIFNRCSHYWIGVEQVVILKESSLVKLDQGSYPFSGTNSCSVFVMTWTHRNEPVASGCHREGHLIPMGETPKAPVSLEVANRGSYRFTPLELLAPHLSRIASRSPAPSPPQPMGGHTSCFFTSKLKSDVIYQSVEKSG